MIAFRHFALRRGARLLLSDIDLVIQSGWRLGVVGRNGCGKSSLFAALQGQVEADAGELDLPARLRLASVAQETPALPDPAIEYVMGGDEELAIALRMFAFAVTLVAVATGFGAVVLTLWRTRAKKNAVATA